MHRTLMNSTTEIETIRRHVSICMFDLYGTVVDMQAGLTQAVTPYLKTKGWAGEPTRLVTWWRRTHFENSMIDGLLHRRTYPTAKSGASRCRTRWSARASRTRKRK